MTTVAHLTTLVLSLLVAPLAIHAPQGPPPWRIGFLGAEAPATSRHFLDAFRHGLQNLERFPSRRMAPYLCFPWWAGASHSHVPYIQVKTAIGYVEGQTITIEARWADGRHDRFPALASELVQLPVHVLLAISTPAALAAKQETPAIPIIFVAGEPLGSGVVASLARPGGNMTGLSLTLGEAFAGKWLELLREALPTVSQVALFWNPANPANAAYVTALQVSAQRLGVTLHPQGIRDPSQFDRAFAAMATARAQALIVLTDPLTVRYRD